MENKIYNLEDKKTICKSIDSLAKIILVKFENLDPSFSFETYIDLINFYNRFTDEEIKEYIKYAMNHKLSVVIEVKDKENLIESVQYLFDYVDAIGDQVVEDHIWTP